MSTSEIAEKILGILYLSESRDTHDPKNKFIARKWIQNIKRNSSFENK